MPPPPLYSLENLDFDNPQFDLEAIRRVNPQRHEMEQLTAVLRVDLETRGLVGYKDISQTEFWITGHMPGFPLMPGVVMCECAAQLAGFFARKYDILGGDYLRPHRSSNKISHDDRVVLHIRKKAGSRVAYLIIRWDLISQVDKR